MTSLTFDVQTLIGPVSGLAISLLFAMNMLKEYKKMTERLVSAFEQEVKHCEDRYRQVFDELLKIKEKQNA